MKDMEMGKLDLHVIEKECEKEGKGYVPREQVELLQKSIVISKAHQDLGISTEPPKGSK